MDEAIGNTTGHFSSAPAAAAGQDKVLDREESGSSDVGQDMEHKHLYAGREWSSNHSLNVRVSFPLGVGRYYLTVVAGKERRARARLALDRRRNPLDTPGNVVFLAFVATIATAGSAMLLYLFLAHLLGWTGRLIL